MNPCSTSARASTIAVDASQLVAQPGQADGQDRERDHRRDRHTVPPATVKPSAATAHQSVSIAAGRSR